MIGGPERFEPDPFGSLPTEELALARLPPGRHCLPRSFVLRSQRLRIVAGMLHGLHEHSYPGTTIGHITAEARVSPGRFLPGVRRQGGLLLATSDAVSRWVCERVEAAVAGAADWEGVHAGAALGLVRANAAFSIMDAAGGMVGILGIGIAMELFDVDGLPYIIMFASLVYMSYAVTRYRVR